jgi:hypothetical protein
MKRTRGERGQVLVEAAIVMPVMVFVVLGALQLALLQHARVMTEYAAYNAARAGIVHNADWNMMRNAATWSVLPIYRRTHNVGQLLVTWAAVGTVNAVGNLVDITGATLETIVTELLGVNFSGFLPDVSLVEVSVTSPTEEDLREGLRYQASQEERSLADDTIGKLDYPEREVDFDQPELIAAHPRVGRLAVEVRVLAPLRVPLVNWIFFQLWFAQEELRLAVLKSNLEEWSRWQASIAAGEHAGKTLEEVVRDAEGRQVFDDPFLTTQRTKEARLLRDVATDLHIYLLPLRASYAMQLQSNPFWDNRREPLWFSFSGGP